MSGSAQNQPLLQYSNEDCRNFIDCWCPIPVRAFIARLAAGEAANTEIAPDLFERIEHAIGRITRGEGTMRVPADNTDPDLVLAECRDVLSALMRRQTRDAAGADRRWHVGERVEWQDSPGNWHAATITDARPTGVVKGGMEYDATLDSGLEVRGYSGYRFRVVATPPASGEAALNGARPLPADRDTLGRFVREAWVRWAQQQPNPKPSWLVPYGELPEADKEADRQIGEAVARWTLILDASRLAAVAPASGGIDAMVNRFLAWPLPQDFVPDCYVSFDREKAKANNGWPIGTNLFTADQAKAMFAHCVAAVAPAGMCTWSQCDADGSDWDTGCGHLFMLNDGSPSENSMSHCCFCGERIGERLWRPDDDDATPPATAGQE